MRDGNRYLWCLSQGDRAITLWVSDRLTSLGVRHVVWTAPDAGPCSHEVWAPELHRIGDRWYIYFAASDGRNETHLSYVLRSRGADPFGPYTVHGPLRTGGRLDAEPLWAIDMTTFVHGGRRYAAWSGWDRAGHDHQYLYIAPMADPLTLAAARTRLAGNGDFAWERVSASPRARGLNEAPEALERAGQLHLTYSCAASWRTTYAIGALDLVGDDPLDATSWRKRSKPLFPGLGFGRGAGHGCFVASPDESETWFVYHTKVDDRDGWRRAICLAPIEFDHAGVPQLRDDAMDRTLPLPSGTVHVVRGDIALSLTSPSDLQGWSYFGHRQYVAQRPDGLRMGFQPSAPVNGYRAGEKVVLDDGAYRDLDASVVIRFPGGGRDAGLLFRVSLPSLGFDAQRGYFAGIVPDGRYVVLGAMDGTCWREIARADAPVGEDRTLPHEHALRVRAEGAHLRISVDGRRVIDTKDSTYRIGSVGMRVVDTDAIFRDLRIQTVR